MPLVSHMLLLNIKLIFEVRKWLYNSFLLCWNINHFAQRLTFLPPSLRHITKIFCVRLLASKTLTYQILSNMSEMSKKKKKNLSGSMTKYLIHRYQTFIDVPPWLCCSCFFNCDCFLFSSVTGFVHCLTISYCVLNAPELSNTLS